MVMECLTEANDAKNSKKKKKYIYIVYTCIIKVKVK